MLPNKSQNKYSYLDSIRISGEYLLSVLEKAKDAGELHHLLREKVSCRDRAGAAEDFQTLEDGSFDTEVTDPVLIEMWCSSCWHYDREKSPNGGRRDLCVPTTEKLIHLEKITVPTLVICGDKDPYLNFDLIKTSLSSLPQGSELEIIKGGSHVMYIEKPFYHDFQKRLIQFLRSN